MLVHDEACHSKQRVCIVQLALCYIYYFDVANMFQETLEDIDKDHDGYISMKEYIGKLFALPPSVQRKWEVFS